MPLAIDKIESILTSEYSVMNYVQLVQEIFDNMKLVSPDKFRKESTNFSSHIAGATHIGNYIAPNGQKMIIFSVELLKGTYVESSRSMQRGYAKKLIENSGADAAMVAFYTPGDSKWRLSYVRLDYELKFENGKLQTAENMTPAKRYSFLVGKDEPCHTAIDRLRRFLDNRNYTPSLDDLEDAFSVDRVSDDFFKYYSLNFTRIYRFLEKQEAFKIEAGQCGFSTSQFAKKLLGQIVFLYFLQKKGWLGVNAWPQIITEKDFYTACGCHGSVSKNLVSSVYHKDSNGQYVISNLALSQLDKEDEELLSKCIKGEPWGSGPKNFIRILYNSAVSKGKNFYHEYLEPLFYNALNVNRDERCFCAALHCRIPFLSGGLFEPINGYDWEKLKLEIPNDFFSNQVDGNLRTGDGLLDIFDRYNFTMSEDEPLEREVAIDPEMLGKVFERLLDIDERRERATYYTPKSIVHYMSQESIKNYLVQHTSLPKETISKLVVYGLDFQTSYPAEFETITSAADEIDHLLSIVKVVDICVGSGAFLLGVLNEIVKIREILTPFVKHSAEQRTAYGLKLQTINNSLFACDIDPCAVDIAKLRLWLSLIIDDECIPGENPKPLPNLNYHFTSGNSVIDEFEGAHFDWKSSFSHTDSRFALLTSMMEEQESLFNNHDWIAARDTTRHINEKYNSLITGALPYKLSSMYQRNVCRTSMPFVVWQWKFPKIFLQKGGFDILIGNPPYLNTEEIHAHYSDKDFDYFRRRYKCAYKQFDICFLFMEKAKELLNSNGLLCYIVPNKFYKTDAGKMLRGLLSDGMIKMDDFGDTQLFEEKTIYSAIILATNHPVDEMRYTSISSVQELWNYDQCDSITINTKDLGENPWRLTTDLMFMKLLERIKPYSVPLSSVANIFNGIQTSAERPPVYWFSTDEIVSESSTDYVISKDEKNYTIEKKILHPYFKPTKAHEKGMQTYSLLETNKYIIFPYTAAGTLIDIETMQRDYAGTYQYLLDYYEYLVPKCLNKGKGRDIPNATHETWYQYGRSQSLTAFINTPKLIVRVLSKEPMYAYDEKDMLIASGGTAGYCAVAALQGSKYDLSYIQAWLNHPYTEKYLTMMGSDFENGFTARGTYSLKTVPFIDLDFSDNGQKAIYDEVVELSHKIYQLRTTSKTSREADLIRENIGRIEALITRVYKLEFGE